MSGSVVRIYESEMSCLVHETASHPDIETGGSLFGLWTDGGNPTILLASRPGPRAVRQVTTFEQDVETHRLIERLLVDNFGAQSVGLWHSHHHLGLHELSGGDIRRTMTFARRARRTRFCDLLSYFSDGSRRSSRAEVTVKPYVYVDAGEGRRAPASIVVLPGMSPIRAALATQSVPAQLAAELHIAIPLPPEDWQPRWRAARSVGVADREDEDAPVSQSGRGLRLLRWGRQGTKEPSEQPDAQQPETHRPESTPAAIESRDSAQTRPDDPSVRTDQERPHGPERPPETSSSSTAPPVSGQFPAPPAPASHGPETAGSNAPSYAIPDLQRYIHELLEPALRGAPRGVSCELEPIHDGHALRLTLLSANRREEHVLELGWDGRSGVVTRHVVRLAEQPDPRDLIRHGEIHLAPDRISRVLHIIARGGR